MRNSNLKLTITAAALAGSVALFSVFAHAEGNDMMASDSEHNGMMSSEGKHGMGGMMPMMSMMSDMSPEDRKAMTEACMKMMQSHGINSMGDAKNEDADAS